MPGWGWDDERFLVTVVDELNVQAAEAEKRAR
jgi:hypothetical protein